MEPEQNQDERLEAVLQAIHQLLEERRNKGKHKKAEEEEDLLLSRLLSQLESLEKDGNAAHLLEGPPNKEAVVSSSMSKARDCGDREEVAMDEIVKEIRQVKRQNFITHCLLSLLIIITAFWQFSEVSLLLKVKEKFSNPLRTVGDMIMGSWKGRGNKPQIEAPPLPPISVPELPHVDLPSVTIRGLEDSQ